jgi:hypothetical protein
MLKLPRQTHSCMQANRYRSDENYGQTTTSQGNEVCRDEVCFDSRSSRKTYDANLGANRIRVDNASRERQAFDEEQCTCKQLQHLQSFGRAS